MRRATLAEKSATGIDDMNPIGEQLGNPRECRRCAAAA
jgi:hypothetical protein